MFSHMSVEEQLYCFYKNRAHNTSDYFACNFSHSVIYLYLQVFLTFLNKKKEVDKDTINVIGIVRINNLQVVIIWMIDFNKKSLQFI